MDLKLPSRGKNHDAELAAFVETLRQISRRIGFKVSARGWCYILEQPPYQAINKSQFDLVENIINNCRRDGTLPIDFTSDEEGRQFSGVEIPESSSPVQYMREYLEATLNCGSWYKPDWWVGENYYIQMIVEKIDLKTLFEPVCRDYHIPIATAKGWSSMLQRAEYAKRFSEAEERGLKCILLYCGDHDPDGLRISDFLRTNLEDLKDIVWHDGTGGYDPTDLIIKRFGLDYDFIKANKLSWIDNLITGSGKNLASPSHKNHHMEYVQTYLHKFGARKCEANSLVVRPEQGRQLCRDAIVSFLGMESRLRFQRKRNRVQKEMKDFRERTGLEKAVLSLMHLIDKESKKSPDKDDDSDDEDS